MNRASLLAVAGSRGAGALVSMRRFFLGAAAESEGAGGQNEYCADGFHAEFVS